MHAVILSDGSYWATYGLTDSGQFVVVGILHGTASVSGGNVSGTFTDFGDYSTVHGTYTGSVSAQQSLNLTFTDPSDLYISTSPYNMSYDSIYNQPASLSAVSGNYLGVGFSGYSDYGGTLTISGSSLTIGSGECPISGTIAPHGTVNVFDVSFTDTHCGNGNAPNTYTGILFQTSGKFSGYIEIVAVSGNTPYFYMGSK
jgi:hypothetical protein